MEFNFPKKSKKFSVRFNLKESIIRKAAKLADIYECTSGEIYETLLEEALEEYEKSNSSIEEKPTRQVYSVNRDVVKAGDNLRSKIDPQKEFVEDGRIKKNKQILFCQNRFCPKSERKYEEGMGTFFKRDGELYRFCSESCKVEGHDFIENNDGKEGRE